MECIHCQNCKQGQHMYYCAAKDDFVIDTQETIIIEKSETSWKKGNPNYEEHRRKNHKEL